MLYSQEANKGTYTTIARIQRKKSRGGVFEFAREGGRGPRHSNGNFTMNYMLLIFPGGPDPPDQTIPSRSVHATGRIKKNTYLKLKKTYEKKCRGTSVDLITFSSKHHH